MNKFTRGEEKTDKRETMLSEKQGMKLGKHRLEDDWKIDKVLGVTFERRGKRVDRRRNLL